MNDAQKHMYSTYSSKDIDLGFCWGQLICSR